jgi:hypothetical protein
MAVRCFRMANLIKLRLQNTGSIHVWKAILGAKKALLESQLQLDGEAWGSDGRLDMPGWVSGNGPFKTRHSGCRLAAELLHTRYVRCADDK